MRKSTPPTDRQELGKNAETLACNHLKRKGFDIVSRNYRALRGEVDIICKDRDDWVFVEVKARSSNRFGGAAAAIPRSKQEQVAKVASHYLMANGLYGEVACRFDVVLVDAGTRPYRVTHIPNAFHMESS